MVCWAETHLKEKVFNCICKVTLLRCEAYIQSAHFAHQIRIDVKLSWLGIIFASTCFSKTHIIIVASFTRKLHLRFGSPLHYISAAQFAHQQRHFTKHSLFLQLLKKYRTSTSALCSAQAEARDASSRADAAGEEARQAREKLTELSAKLAHAEAGHSHTQHEAERRLELRNKVNS